MRTRGVRRLHSLRCGRPGAELDDDARAPGSDSLHRGVPATRIRRYRPRIEGLFARIERWTRRSDGDVHWRSISKDNILTIYGKDRQLAHRRSRRSPAAIFTWLICETRDDKGNAVLYDYKAEDGAGVDLSAPTSATGANATTRAAPPTATSSASATATAQPLLDDAGQRPRILDRRRDSRRADWMFEVVFDYGEHDADAPTPRRRRPWSLPRRSVLLLPRRLRSAHHPPLPAGADVPSLPEPRRASGNDCLVRSTDFTTPPRRSRPTPRNPVYTFLRSVTQSGYQPQQTAAT